MTQLDLDFVRAQFPAFSEAPLKDMAFFENAGGSYPCIQVIERLQDYYRHSRIQPFFPNPVSTRAGDWMQQSYTSLAPWLNVPPEEIYFGPSTSQNTYVLANAVLGWLKAGDEIIVTNQDHEANSGAWRRLNAAGIVVREWQVDPQTGELSMKRLEQLVTPTTRLLVFPHCSNILGKINPVSQICKFAREHEIRTVVDGVSFAGHGLPDVTELGADIYLFSLYKVFGPHLGVMTVKKSMASKLQNQSHFFLDETREKRLYPAGPDHAQVAAAQGVSEYLEAIFQHHTRDLSQPLTGATSSAETVRSLFRAAELPVLAGLLDYLDNHPDIRVIGPTHVENRAPTVAIEVRGMHPLKLAEALGKRGVLCGAGHFYSYRLLAAMGIEPGRGVLRFSLLHYTSEEDVARLIAALHDSMKDAL